MLIIQLRVWTVPSLSLGKFFQNFHDEGDEDDHISMGSSIVCSSLFLLFYIFYFLSGDEEEFYEQPVKNKKRNKKHSHAPEFEIEEPTFETKVRSVYVDSWTSYFYVDSWVYYFRNL